MRIPPGASLVAAIRSRGRIDAGRVHGANAVGLAALRLFPVSTGVSRLPKVSVAPRAGGSIQTRPESAPGAAVSKRASNSRSANRTRRVPSSSRPLPPPARGKGGRSRPDDGDRLRRIVHRPFPTENGYLLSRRPTIGVGYITLPESAIFLLRPDEHRSVGTFNVSSFAASRPAVRLSWVYVRVASRWNTRHGSTERSAG